MRKERASRHHALGPVADFDPVGADFVRAGAEEAGVRGGVGLPGGGRAGPGFDGVAGGAGVDDGVERVVLEEAGASGPWLADAVDVAAGGGQGVAEERAGSAYGFTDPAGEVGVVLRGQGGDVGLVSCGPGPSGGAAGAVQGGEGTFPVGDGQVGGGPALDEREGGAVEGGDLLLERLACGTDRGVGGAAGPDAGEGGEERVLGAGEDPPGGREGVGGTDDEGQEPGP